MGFSCSALKIESWSNGNRGHIKYDFCDYFIELDKLGVPVNQQVELFNQALKLGAAYMGAIYSPMNDRPAPTLMCNKKDDCPIRARILASSQTSTE